MKRREPHITIMTPKGEVSMPLSWFLILVLAWFFMLKALYAILGRS